MIDLSEDLKHSLGLRSWLDENICNDIFLGIFSNAVLAEQTSMLEKVQIDDS